MWPLRPISSSGPVHQSLIRGESFTVPVAARRTALGDALHHQGKGQQRTKILRRQNSTPSMKRQDAGQSWQRSPLPPFVSARSQSRFVRLKKRTLWRSERSDSPRAVMGVIPACRRVDLLAGKPILCPAFLRGVCHVNWVVVATGPVAMPRSLDGDTLGCSLGPRYVTPVPSCLE